MNKKKFKRRLKKIFNPKLLMVYFVIFIMVGSGAGFVMNYNTGGGSIEYYNDYRIMPNEQGYVIYYDNEELQFLTHPQQAESFDMSDDILQVFENAEYFTVSFDPNINDRGEIQYATSIIFQHPHAVTDKIVGVGVTEEDMANELNKFNCSDSSTQSPAVIFKEGNENDMSYNESNGCLEIFSRDPMHRVQFADYLVYNILDII
ncbi:MAG: hypothetical protein ACLFNK_03000 [Candidatus Woesearchaeota archaeon]